MSTEYQQALKAAQYIEEQITAAGLSMPTAAVVLGSGLGRLTEEMEGALHLPYELIPEFPVSTVTTHAGVLSIGVLAGRMMAAFSGRFHFYEGYSMRVITFYVRVLHLLGVRTLLLTNAAGGINESFEVGDLMLITDHIKLTADSPVRGEADPHFGQRFFDMSRTYSPRLRTVAKAKAEALGVSLKEGVYCYMGGPQFETPAEIRMLRLLGGDAVGMSTVPEAIVAVGCGMEVLGLSCITNMAAGLLPDATLSDEEVNVVAGKSYKTFSSLVCGLISEL